MKQQGQNLIKETKDQIKEFKYRQNISSSSVRSSKTFNKHINKHSITSAKWVRVYTNLQNKTKCVGFFVSNN